MPFGRKKDEKPVVQTCELLQYPGWKAQTFQGSHYELTAWTATTGGQVNVTVKIDIKTGASTPSAVWASDPKAKHGPEMPHLGKSIKIRVITNGKRKDETLNF